MMATGRSHKRVRKGPSVAAQPTGLNDTNNGEIECLKTVLEAFCRSREAADNVGAVGDVVSFSRFPGRLSSQQ